MTENIIILAGGASSRMKKSTDQNLSPQKIAQANKLAALFVIRGTDGRFTEKVTPQFVEARERSRIEPQK